MCSCFGECTFGLLLRCVYFVCSCCGECILCDLVVVSVFVVVRVFCVFLLYCMYLVCSCWGECNWLSLVMVSAFGVFLLW